MGIVMAFLMSNASPDLIAPVRAEEAPMDVICALAYPGDIWTDWTGEGHAIFKEGSSPVALKAAILNQPKGMTGTVQYQVNVSGHGWSDTFENGEATGMKEGASLLESVRVFLNGDLARHYDVYTSALVEGKWLDYAMNGEDAGEAGVGKHLDGICILITKKGEAPKEKPAAPSVLSTASSAESDRILDPTKPMVALTFDDGPSAYDYRIMNALEAVGGRGTFFMIGRKVGNNRKVVERMITGGHELGNHSWDHPSFSKLSSDQIVSQIQRTNDAIAAISGGPARLMRPPYGAIGGKAKPTLSSLGYAASLWSIDTLDWKTKNTEKTVNAVLSNVRDGDVVLMHSVYEASAAAAERIIPELARRGYQLVTVSELANARGKMTPGKAYGAFR